jgi:energy-coupling factor transport system permease protein
MEQKFNNTKIKKSRQIEFERLNPAIIFLYFITLITITMVFNSPIILLLEFLIVLGLSGMTAGIDATLKTLRGTLLMMLFIIIVNPITNHNGDSILFSANGLIITKEATIYGILMAFSLANVILIFVSYNKVMSNNKFMFLFGKILPQLTLLTMIVMRFVPLFLERFKSISQIQKTRGIQVNSKNIKEKSINTMRLVEVLLINSCYEAFQTADSMTARGFGSTQRSNYRRYKFNGRDLLIGSILMIGILYLIFAIFNKIGIISIYPDLIIPSMTSNIEILTMIIVGGICGLPILMEVREALWWTFSK